MESLTFFGVSRELFLGFQTALWSPLPISFRGYDGTLKSIPQEQSMRESKRRKGVRMSIQPDGLAKWHTFVSEQDTQALAEALADDVLFHSPAFWKPKAGKATAMLYFSSAARVLQDFTYHRQFVGDNAVVLEFSARVGQLSVKGVDIIQLNAQGQIVDFEVMVRPANGLQALAAAMAQQLASADSPP